jgi:hypothetical protein
MKTLFTYILFASLLFLAGCTITKRKYTGGFYVDWHSKAPDARLISQKKAADPATTKIAQTNSSSVKTKLAPQTEKTASAQAVKAFQAATGEKEIAKSISIPIAATNTVTPVATAPVSDIPKTKAFTGKVCFSLVLLLLGMVCEALTFLNSASLGFVLLFFLGAAFYLLSVHFSKKVLKEGANTWASTIIAFDLLGIISLAILILALVA